ncbi:MAG: aromatic ring-hydroxylating dioxygenase subunit alpha [Alphaproteobacteria bacterium]|nr:aromatic ring-hydroxylating dioxygenase subunit alpha [Alphaproteobacteria bacterium]
MVRRHRWTQLYPELGQGPIPTEPYVSEEIYQREIELIFKKSWLRVARVEEVPEPGSYKVKRLHFANTAIIIVRAKDGVVRAFHNVCSHRGNTVVTETGDETFGHNKSAVLPCRFHGWVYGADGTLVSVPEEDRFYSCFERGHNGLTPVATDVWEGFVFINLDPRPLHTLAEFLGGYAGHFGGYPYAALTECYSYTTYLDCNWKIGHDSFSEAYHVTTIHAGSFPNVFSTGLADVQFFGPHRTCAVCLNLTQAPTKVAVVAGSVHRGSLVQKAAERRMLPPSINPSGRHDFAFELSTLFPNLLLHVAEGIWFTHQFWPIARNRTIWEGKYYVRAAQTNSQRWALEYAQVLQRNAWLEDTQTMENTQKALESGAKRYLNLQDEEILIRHNAHVLADRLAAAE